MRLYAKKAADLGWKTIFDITTKPQGKGEIVAQATVKSDDPNDTLLFFPGKFIGLELTQSVINKVKTIKYVEKRSITSVVDSASANDIF